MARKMAILILTFLLPHAALAETVAVIGGGLAGLTAAFELQKWAKKSKKNLDVEVFEAKDRPGGRVFTVMLNGTPAEMGGENFNDGGEALELRRLAKELGLKVRKRPRQVVPTYYYDRETQKRYELSELIPYFPPISQDEMVQILRELSGTSATLQEVIDGFFKKYPTQDPKTAEMRALIGKIIGESVHSYEGGETGTMSPRYATTTLVWLMGRMRSKSTKDPEPIDSIDGGNSRLVLALAKKLGSHLHLNRPLAKLVRKGELFELRFKGADKPVLADVVVMAIPGRPYGNIEFGEGTIEPERLQAIQKIGYGTHAKILVPGPAPKSPSVAFTENALVWRRGDEKWTTIYLVGAAGIMPGDDEIKSSFERANLAMPNDSKLKISDVSTPKEIFQSFKTPVTVSWALEPYIQGSYSHFRADTRKYLEPNTLFAPIQNRIFFAGEHTTEDPDIRGTMEAAVASGVRVAKQIETRD